MSDRADGAGKKPRPASGAAGRRASAGPWALRFARQFGSMVRKNLLLSRRNHTATALQLCSSFLFILLIFATDAIVQASREVLSAYRNIESPVAVPIRPIADCSDNQFLRAGEPCFTFVYAPAGDEAVEAVVEAIRAHNTPPIPGDKVHGFASAAEIDAYLLAHPETVNGALSFDLARRGQEVQRIAFDLQVNDTVRWWKGSFQSPTFDFLAPLQAAAEREIVRHLAGRGEDLTWAVAVREFAHPPLQAQSVVARMASNFLFAALMFGFVLQVQSVVLERESGLRQAMRTMGLLDSAYWASWALWEAILTAVAAALMVAFGLAFRFDLFARNSLAALFLLFFLFGLSMSGVAFLVSPFIPSSQQATSVGFGIFILGWIFQTVVTFGFPYQPKYVWWWQAAFSLLPWNLFAKGLNDLGDATATSKDLGISWGQRFSYCRASEPSVAELKDLGYFKTSCSMPLGEVYWWLLGTYGTFLVLAVYLDAVVSGGRRPWFFLQLSYWLPGGHGGRHRPTHEHGLCSCVTLPRTEGSGTGARAIVGTPGMRSALTAATARGEGSGATPGGDQHMRDEDVVAEEDRVRRRCQWYLDGVLGASPAPTDPGALGPVPHSAPPSPLPPPAAADSANGGFHDVDLKSRTAAAGATGSQSLSAAAGEGVGSGGIEPAPAPEESAAAAVDEDDGSGGGLLIELFGLGKRFGGAWSFRDILPAYLRGAPPKQAPAAVEGTWLGIREGELFCLLGPNGAGKTTTINCLTGVTAPSCGDAALDGECITAPGGIDRVRAVMGVCPQFDVLWGELTGAEHMQLFAALKGLPGHTWLEESAALLEEVKLTGAADTRASAYSGGMRRRLSVAIALLGDPKVVFLDEPTTGMDPISRRHVWDVILRAKRGRAVVLTTHSMEEADVLGDRIAIMAHGRLRCLGTSLHLKARYGHGYSVSIRVLPVRPSTTAAGAGVPSLPLPTWCTWQLEQRKRDIRKLLRERLVGGVVLSRDDADGPPGGVPPYAEYVHAIVPKDREADLGEVFGELARRSEELHIADVQVAMTSLEDVFLHVAEQAAFEAARNGGRTVTLSLEREGVSLEAPIGAPHVSTPGGERYHLKWGTDDDGEITMLDYWQERGEQILQTYRA